MTGVNWGLLQVPNIGQNAMSAFIQGKEMRREVDTRNAMTKILQGGMTGTPGTPPIAGQPDPQAEAWNTLYANDPKVAFELQGKVQERDKQARLKTLMPLAAQGDAKALQEVMGIDFDTWKSMDATQRERIKAQNTYVGQQALYISRLPAAEQAAAWDNAIREGVSLGYQGLAGQEGKYTPQGLQAAISNAGLVERYISLAEPKYRVVPQGADLVNERDPDALRAFGVRDRNTTPPTTPPVAQPTASAQDAFRNATGRGFVLPEEAQAIKAQLGPNGQAAFDGWLKQNNVKVVTRTGTDASGRKVVQFEDGTIQYAD